MSIKGIEDLALVIFIDGVLYKDQVYEAAGISALQKEKSIEKTTLKKPKEEHKEEEKHISKSPKRNRAVTHTNEKQIFGSKP